MVVGRDEVEVVCLCVIAVTVVDVIGIVVYVVGYSEDWSVLEPAVEGELVFFDSKDHSVALHVGEAFDGVGHAEVIVSC